jgi:2-polyprenyl-6-methoxyphenol hydroxylase-like FAD-dependent oxidoreductase
MSRIRTEKHGVRMRHDVLETTCCVVGGGPAGVMLGYLLARRGVRVTVLEKHNDFFRDFRGDTVHPSTLEVLHELGLLEEFLKMPHQKVTSVGGVIGDFAFQGPDFRHVPAHCKFVAMMPQWEFLNFLSDRGKKFPSFDLRMQHEAVDLTRNGERITGVLARGPGRQPVEIRADLVVGCDGRHSITRTAGQLEVLEFGVPIDVLWFCISRKPGDPQQVLGNVNYGKALVLIDRSDYFQAGLIIPKRGFEEIKRRGLEAFRTSILQIAPYFDDRVDELKDWEQVKILTVQLNRLRRWHRPGLLCIGDAAHAMSPAGGVGINLAIQDAVAAANLLAHPLRQRCLTEAALAAVQRRRELPTRLTQAIQLFLHKGFARVFQNSGPLHAPWQLKVALRIPGVHRALGYAVGIGVRPEHVQDARGARPLRRKRPALVIAIAAALGTVAAIIAVHRARRSRSRGPRHARFSRAEAGRRLTKLAA